MCWMPLTKTSLSVNSSCAVSNPLYSHAHIKFSLYSIQHDGEKSTARYRSCEDIDHVSISYQFDCFELS